MGVCVSETIELKMLNSATFAKMITDDVANSGNRITYLDAVEDFLARNDEVEPETIASLIQRNQKLKALIYDDAEMLNLVEKTSAKLPID